MEIGKRKTENKERHFKREQFSAFQPSFFVEKICSACGAEVRRESAKFCLVCGKFLREDYQPLDALRASYRLQGKSFLIENAPQQQQQQQEIINLFPKNENSISETAWACLVYSFMPYLGILFVPLAFAVGLFAFAVSLKRPNSSSVGGGKLALTSIAMSFVVLAIQIFLWWLLYFIPEIGKQI